MSKVHDLGLLVLRLTFGGLMAFSHGWGKFTRLISGDEIRFADPIGLGVELSLALAASSEFLCALLVAVGLFTRLGLIPLAFTMAVAAFIVHGGDPLGDREMALLYLSAFVTLFLTGPGRFTLQNLIAGRLNPENKVVRYLTR